MSEFLLLEIGTEEIPARFLDPAKEGLLKLVRDAFTQSRIGFGDINIQATPRRMALFVQDVAEKQEETVAVKFGPPYNRAFDESGNPTRAAIGFAKSQGVEVSALTKGIKDNVEFVTLEKMEKGNPTADMLPQLLPDIIAKIPFQKKMRWGSGTFEYARPIQWVMCIFGSEAISFPVADVVSAPVTFGHRFLSKGPINIGHPLEYVDGLRKNFIIINEDERMEIIREGISRIEKETGGQAIRDEELVREILYITEYPYPLKGTFEEVYLGIPKEVLVNVMKAHQRYIPVEDSAGRLLPCFIFFANTVPKDDSNVVRGNEKVLRARLADARFFFDEDRKVRLADRYERLASIVFHVKLGTLKDKMERVRGITLYLASILDPSAADKLERLISLMKTDLVTHMVGEFPELQGTMGRIYAEFEGEDTDVARAIEEHYLPTGGMGNLPVSSIGAIAAIADKLDSIVSFFSVGINPTGNLDPYALRRQSLGIIKIAIERALHLPLRTLLEKAYDSGAGIQKRLAFEEARNSITEFIATRFKFSMLEEGHNQEFVESVLPCVAADIYDGYMRLVSLETQRSMEDFQRLMVGFRRVYNITKQITEMVPVDPAALVLDEEKQLFSLYSNKKDIFLGHMKKRDYDNALAVLVGFKETIDNFFDKVFVMDKDEAIKANRLALLTHIKDMFLTFADFSKIHFE
ncbi:MAG: glycine--tRNA ligase subunit beta [Syntrophorhabdaceae bacterium]|nr:glycine--tRNA ligase subunit beta [Syntrophorhabdaceae bacterium]MDD4195679.1 glycine--tRNA ligase subunit beta [Syntrophorhabdaceae bacterium]